MSKKGVLRVRQINKLSRGITLPKEMVKFLDLNVGLYHYETNKENEEITIKIKLLSKV